MTPRSLRQACATIGLLGVVVAMAATTTGLYLLVRWLLH